MTCSLGPFSPLNGACVPERSPGRGCALCLCLPAWLTCAGCPSHVLGGCPYQAPSLRVRKSIRKPSPYPQADQPPRLPPNPHQSSCAPFAGPFLLHLKILFFPLQHLNLYHNHFQSPHSRAPLGCTEFPHRCQRCGAVCPTPRWSRWGPTWKTCTGVLDPPPNLHNLSSAPGTWKKCEIV